MFGQDRNIQFLNEIEAEITVRKNSMFGQGRNIQILDETEAETAAQKTFFLEILILTEWKS